MSRASEIEPEGELPERIRPPFNSDEATTLTGFLDFERATLERKCHGLIDDQLRSRAVPPSVLSLLGLVRHMAEVERGWFAKRLAGEEPASLWCTPAHPDADFDDADEADVAEAFRQWSFECDRARALAAAPLETSFIHPLYGEMSLRWLLIHMIEEYSRHLGHADLLRERIDGSTGE